MTTPVQLSGSAFGLPIVVGTSLVLIHLVPDGKNDEIKNDNSGSGDDITLTWTDRNSGTETQTFTVPARSSVTFRHTLVGGTKLEAQSVTISDFRVVGAVRRSR